MWRGVDRGGSTENGEAALLDSKIGFSFNAECTGSVGTCDVFLKETAVARWFEAPETRSLLNLAASNFLELCSGR